MDADTTFQIQLEHIKDFEFKVKFDWDDVSELLLDEPSPLGDQHGPNASRLLAAAVGNCLSASLMFCLGKVRLQHGGMTTRVSGRLVRNAAGRLRVGGFEVHIDLRGLAGEAQRLERCTRLFEDFCVVTASVREGVPVAVSVAADGTELYRSDGFQI